MSNTVSVDLAQASYIMDIQNGSSSLVTSSSHEPTNTTPLSSPDSGRENTEYLQSPQVIYRPPHPYDAPMLMMITMPEGMPTSEHTPTSASPPQEADLLTLLRNQLEYYFSKDNLATDKYLLSQMDGDHFVPISILASFNQVKRLSNDMNLITKAIKESNNLQLDSTNTKVRAIPEKRCILILREIPKETPKEDVFNLFTGERCPDFISCDFAENDCWYVTFCSEEAAQEAYRYLREEVREFLGKPIRARIKNTAVQRAASLPKPRPQYSFSTVQPVPYYQQPITWPYFTDQTYAAAQYINGFPPHPTFGGPPQSGPRFGLPANNTAAAVPRDVNVRKNNVSNTSGGGKGRHSVGNEVTGERRGSSSSYTGRENRSRRDDERDRMRNLPNRLKNKRSEEMLSGVSDKREEKLDKPTDKDKTDRSGGERGYNRQRTQNRAQPKLDFAPANFPPLPGQIEAIAIPPPPPLPPSTSEEGKSNLADIVKGRRGNGTDKPLSTGSSTVVSPEVNPSNPPQSISPPPLPTTTITITTTTTTTAVAAATIPISHVTPVTSAAGPVTKVSNITANQATQATKSKPDLKTTVTKEQKAGITISKIQAPTKVNEKDSSNNKIAASRNNSVVRTQSNNGMQRNRYKDSKETKKTNNNSSSRPTQRHSPKPSKNLTQVPPPPPSSSELEEKEKMDDPPKLERMSYAQMAGQKKPKPSPQKTSSTNETKVSNSPPLSPNSTGNEPTTTTSPLLSPSSSPVQSDLPPTSKN